jgi:hypothetical protein
VIDVMLLSSLTTEDATFLVTVFVPLAGALFWLGVTHHKLSTLKDDMKELKKNVTDLTIRIESHILAVEAWEESRRKEEEENKK